MTSGALVQSVGPPPVSVERNWPKSFAADYAKDYVTERNANGWDRGPFFRRESARPNSREVGFAHRNDSRDTRRARLDCHRRGIRYTASC